MRCSYGTVVLVGLIYAGETMAGTDETFVDGLLAREVFSIYESRPMNIK
jgi:hypothetical protein